MEGQADAFHVRYLSEWTLDRLYRVYPARRVLYFIRIGGQGGPEVIQLGFGLLGALFEGHMKWKGESRAAEIPHTVQVDPETLVAEHKHNRKVPAVDILEAAITPRPRFPNRPPWLSLPLVLWRYSGDGADDSTVFRFHRFASSRW